MVRQSILVVCLVAVFATSTHAASIQFSDTVSDSGSLAGFTGTGTDSDTLSVIMELPQFDPGLGTLTGVSWTDTVITQDMTATITNTSATETANYNLFWGRVNTSATEFPGIFFVLSGVGTGSFGGLAPGETGDLPISVGWGANNIVSLPDFFFPGYIGGGTVSASRSADAEVTVNSTGLTNPNDFAVTSDTWSVEWTRTITYTFEPIPTPAAAGLGLPLLGLLGITRPRRHRAA